MDDVISDSRGNRPSASMLHRIYACPNSWLLEQKFPTDTKTETAERGTKIHLALEKESPEGLTDEEQDMYFSCLDVVVNNFLHKVLPTPDSFYETERELRMWSKSALYSGKADVIFSWDETLDGENIRVAAIADYKTGNIPAEPVEENKQLQALAALYWQNNKRADNEKWKIYAAIIQPLCSHSPRILELNNQDLLEISEENDKVCKRAVTGEGSSGFRITTHGCRYCKAKSICPDMRKKIEQLRAFDYDGASSEQKQDAYIYGNMAKAAIDELMAKIKAEVIQAHDSYQESPFPKLKYKNGVTRATLQNTREAISKIEAILAPMQDEGNKLSLLDYATISKSGIEKFARNVLSSEENKKNRKDFIASLIEELDKGGFFVYSTTSPSVVIDYRV